MEIGRNIMKACSREKQTPSLLETDEDNPCTEPEMDHYIEQHLQPMGVTAVATVFVSFNG
jgi:hypothetical protein